MAGQTPNPAFDPDSSEALRVRSDIFRRMSPAQKYQQLLDLQVLARDLKRAGVRTAHPQWSTSQIEKAVAEAFLYAAD